MGQKKINKANDAFALKKAKQHNNKKAGNSFGNKHTDRIYHP
jgi:hypothetical protein